MKLEPESLLIGVIDFFAVLLPGAVVTLLVKERALCELHRAGFEEIHGEAAGWAAFLFCSYVLGHFIFLIGSMLDDWVYNRIRKATRSTKGASDDKEPWRLTKWLARRLFGKAPNLAVDRVNPIKNQFLPNVGKEPVVNAFQWAKSKLAVHCPGALTEVQRLEADSKFFRSFVVVLMVLLVWTTGLAANNVITWWTVAVCFALLALSLWRYIERRFKATQQAYWYVLTLEYWPPPRAEREDR